ncbi:MAG: DUF4062 domain-containing protein [Chloroflexi bacterium]|nr:DUF4062 domain-containing protein [Chloroflexota bacterium]
MVIGQQKQYVPIFVGSTFEDLKDYRRAVRDALSQLETIVRGMEYFGSKPSSPIEACLNTVRSCKVYIGILGMRYGSIPDGCDKSMTHLEYEEAQRQSLPSLVYLIDDQNQPVLPRFVETGPGAEKLKSLKDELRKRHVVSFFTTPEDLAAKILHDVPEVLKSIGTKIEGSLDLSKSEDKTDLLRKYKLLPKRYRGRELEIEFENEADFETVDAKLAEAIDVEAGASIRAYLKLTNKECFYVYAENDMAEEILAIPKGARVRVRAITLFGIVKDVDWGEEGTITRVEECTGLLLKRIVQVERP